jgi:hypothetical protein
MLLLLHLERETGSIPQVLQADLKFVLQKCPLLLEEMFKIANLPRPPFGYGWLVSGRADGGGEEWAAGPMVTGSMQCLPGKGTQRWRLHIQPPA